jgi:hypothetical protein
MFILLVIKSIHYEPTAWNGRSGGSLVYFKQSCLRVVAGAMPRNKLIRCETCRKNIKQGWASWNHAKVCRVLREYVADHEALDDVDVGVLDDIGDNEEQPVGHQVDHTVEEHLQRLGDACTLDTKQLVRYAEWGELELTPNDEEIFRFLRSVEIGGGASDAASRASLDYAHSLGGRGLLLPKTVRTCWDKVAKVRAVEFNVCHVLCISPIFVFIIQIIALFIRSIHFVIWKMNTNLFNSEFIQHIHSYILK